MKTKSKKEIKLFYLDFESRRKMNTSASELVEIRTKKNYSWGRVQVDLENGNTVTVRAANKKEKEWALETFPE